MSKTWKSAPVMADKSSIDVVNILGGPLGVKVNEEYPHARHFCEVTITTESVEELKGRLEEFDNALLKEVEAIHNDVFKLKSIRCRCVRDEFSDTIRVLMDLDKQINEAITIISSASEEKEPKKPEGIKVIKVILI